MKKQKTILSLAFATAASVLGGCLSFKTRIESYVPQNENCVVVEMLKQNFYPEIHFRRTYNFHTQTLTTELSNVNEVSGEVFWKARNTKSMEEVRGEENMKRMKKARKKVSNSCGETEFHINRDHSASFLMQRR